MNFANYVEFQAADRPGELALTDPKREMNYGELDAETSAVVASTSLSPSSTST